MGFGTDENGEQGLDENGIAGEDEFAGVNILVENWVVNPTFSEALLSNIIPVDITVEDWVVNPTFSEALLSNSLIAGIININIEVVN